MNNELIERLEAQLDRLVRELTVGIPAQFGEDRSPEECARLSERQARIQQRVRLLRRVLGELPRVGSAALHPDRVGFGSQVKLEDLKRGRAISYTIMSGDSIDIDADEVSVASPIGHALLGRQEGEEVEVMTPQGARRFRILEVRTIFDDGEEDQTDAVRSSRSAPSMDALAAGA